MMLKCRGPIVFDPGVQLQITTLVKKTTSFQGTLFIFFNGPDQNQTPHDRHYSCNNNGRSPHYLEATAWHSLAL